MRRLLITTLVLFALLGGSAFAQQFSTLEERMSEAEFKAAGLDKLSPDELAALNDWLAGKVASSGAAAVAPAPALEDRRGFEGRSAVEGDIVSRISGEFRGWEGMGTRIELDNGQIWEVTDSATRLKVRVQDPQVLIQSGALNSWHLRIEGYNTRAKVKRIK